MGMIKVNPGIEASLGMEFNPVKPGVYTLRVVSHQDRVSQDEGNPYISWRLEHVASADQLTGTDNKPLAGSPGGVFYSTRTDEGTQGLLRGLVEATLGEWRDFEPEELYGKEVEVSLRLSTFNGKTKNEIGKLVKKS